MADDPPRHDPTKILKGISDAQPGTDLSDAKPARGNTDHDPKPEFAARQAALARGVGMPTPPGPGGVSFSPPRQRATAPTGPGQDAPARDAPSVPPGEAGQKRPFRGFSESPSPERASRDQGAPPAPSSGKKPFRGFEPGDVSREFNERSR